MGGWEVPPGYSERLCCTGISYGCFSERSAASQHPLCFWCRRSLMCKAGLLLYLCFPINKVDARISASALVLDGPPRKTVVYLYKELCWLKNGGLVEENVPSACLCSAVGALSVHQQRLSYLTAATLRVRRTSLALHSSLPQQTETLWFCWSWAALSKTDGIFWYQMKTLTGR